VTAKNCEPLVPGAKIKKQVFDFGPGLSWIVSSWSDHAKEAYDYLSYLGLPKTQETIFKLSGTFPKPRTSIGGTASPSAR